MDAVFCEAAFQVLGGKVPAVVIAPVVVAVGEEHAVFRLRPAQGRAGQFQIPAPGAVVHKVPGDQDQIRLLCQDLIQIFGKARAVKGGTQMRVREQGDFQRSHRLVSLEYVLCFPYMHALVIAHCEIEDGAEQRQMALPEDFPFSSLPKKPEEQAEEQKENQQMQQDHHRVHQPQAEHEGGKAQGKQPEGQEPPQSLPLPRRFPDGGKAADRSAQIKEADDAQGKDQAHADDPDHAALLSDLGELFLQYTKQL